jgi:hypothetical protein
VSGSGSSSPATTGTTSSSGGGGGSLNPYATPSASLSATGNASIKTIAGALARNAGWVKFFAILSIIGGALNCITIIYAVFGWMPIWLGVILLKAANLVEEAEASGSEAALTEALERLGRYFKLSGIFAIVAFILVIVFMIIFFAIGAAQGFDSSY